MTRVTGIVKLIKNMMQIEAHQISSFLISATNNSFTEEGLKFGDKHITEDIC
jgi:hypothetical protein